MNSQALTIRILECEESKEQIATEILSALPAWFGIPESTAKYIRESKHMPFFVAYSDRVPIGFLAIKRNTHYAAEVYVMGVLPEHHRCGAGRALLSRCHAWCKAQGCEFLQVKTLDASFPDEGYEKTRRFYEAMGFRPLECLPLSGRILPLPYDGSGALGEFAFKSQQGTAA